MDKEASLNLKQIIHHIKEKWLTLVLIPVIFMVISVLVSLFIIPQEYEAKTSIIIGRASATDKVIQYDEVLMYEKIVKTYSEIARSRLVVEKSLQILQKNMTIESMLKKITVTQQPDTQIMVIRVKAPSAGDAMTMTKTVSEVFIAEAERLYPVANIQIIDKAYLPKKPVSPIIELNIIIALCFGLIVSTGVAFIASRISIEKKIKDKNIYKDLDIYL
jgi:capsular polysaccharide biosynthesis protein